LIKELSMPSEPIDDNDRENKSKKSKPKSLLQLYNNANRAEKRITQAYQEEIRCWYLFAEKFEELKEIKKNNSRFNDRQARVVKLQPIFQASQEISISYSEK
ncbi:29637_t:CDS:1, partial [Gigaspora margarita]